MTELKETLRKQTVIWLTRPYWTCVNFRPIEHQPKPDGLDTLVWKRLQTEIGPHAQALWVYYPAYFFLALLIPPLLVLVVILAFMRSTSAVGLVALLVVLCLPTALWFGYYKAKNARTVSIINDTLIINFPTVRLASPDNGSPKMIQWTNGVYNQSSYCLVVAGESIILRLEQPGSTIAQVEGWVFFVGGCLLFYSVIASF